MTDFTEGQVFRVLATFSLPLLLSTVLQQLYNIADSMIIGNFAGESSLAAVGAAYPITLVLVAIATGTSMGCSVVISQLFGEGKKPVLSQAISTALISFAVLGVVLAAASSLLSGPLMHLINAEGDVFELSRTYLSIYSIGVFPMLIYNCTTGIFTGVGDSRLPFILLLISSVLNVILDLIAVWQLGLGVMGAAWATTISQAVAAILSLIFMFKRLWQKLPRPEGSRFDISLLGQIAYAAVPCILQQGSVAVGHTIMQSIVNGYGTAVIAGYEAASKLHNFAYMAMNTLGTALASFTAQCYGAGRFKRVREGFRAALIICEICALVVIAVFMLLPEPMIRMFVGSDADPQVIETGINYLRIIGPLYILISMIIIGGGLMRGVGRSTIFFVETIAEFAVRIVMCFVLTQALASYTGLFWGWYFGSSTGFILCTILSIYYLRRLPKEHTLPDNLS